MTHAPRRKADIAGIHPLSQQQQGLLFHAREHGERGRDPYFSQDVLVLEGELDTGMFEAAWSDVVACHAMLRTDFRFEDVPQPVQIVFRSRPAQVQWLDWQAEPDAEAALARCIQALRTEGFDLARAADPRLIVAQTAPGRWFLLWPYHHVAVDGWSYAVVLRDLLACYRARRSGGLPALPPARPFSDYLAWLGSQDLPAAERFWQEELAGFDGPTPLPLVRATKAPSAGRAELAVPLVDGAVLTAFVQQQQITVGTLCQGLWALLLARLSPGAAGRTVCFGVTVAGRPPELAGSADMVGLFINTLPLRVALPGHLPVGDWLRALQSHNARLRQFEHLPLARLQALAGSAGRALFDSLLVVENFPVDAALTAQEGALRARLLLDAAADGQPRETGGRNHYPLTLVFVPGQRPRLVFAYDRQHLDDAVVQALAAQVQTLLQGMLADPRQPLDALSLATPDQALAVRAQGQGEPVAPGPALPTQVSRWAERQPDAPAVSAGDGTLSYAQLEQQATGLAHALAARGIRPEDRVAILAERSAAYVVALLAVMKAGAAFMPLDPGQPRERLAQLVDDAGVALVLCQDESAGRSVAGTRPAWRLQDALAAGREAPPQGLPAPGLPGQAAYVIYTSGSTGAPKGAVLTHEGLAQYCAGVLARLQPRPGARFAMVSTVAADLGHTALFGALAAGGCLCLLPTPLAFDPDGFAQWMREQAIDILKIVPGHLAGLLSAQSPVLPAQALVLGGEAAAPALLARLHELAPGLRVLNHYGPTETTVGVLTYEQHGAAQALPLGRPLPGCRLRVLDAALQAVPPGAPGELYIGGGSLARGYLGQPALTAERFVPDPLEPGARLYRSGDRVCWLPDGTLQFLGRADDQVKIRGHRVEPGELAAALRALPGVSDAAVTVQDAQLLAYVTPDTLQGAALLAALRERLPEHLLPAAVVVLAALPRTPNGKLDRRALPQPTRPSDTVGSTAPRNATEATLAGIWAAVLQRPSVGIHDNFFELGGDSILNLQVIARARRQGLRLTPRQVFDLPTIAALAAVATPLATVLTSTALAAAPSAPPDAPLTPIQQRFFAMSQPEPQHWNQAVLLRVDRRLDPALLEAALRHLVQRHAALRLRFAQGPGGWRQRAADAEDARLVETFDLSACSAAEARAEVERLGTQLQQRLNFMTGPLLQAAYFDRGTEEAGRLLLAAHHLAIDSVSWHLLIGELQAACEHLQAGRPPELAAPTAAWLQWAGRLAEHAGTRVAESAYWLDQGLEQAAAAHAPAVPTVANTFGQAREHSVQAPAALSRMLLTLAPKRLRCRTEDLLLTALSQALCGWQGSAAVDIELEGHGREPLFDDLDTSGTVGWFTARYPVRLRPGQAGGVAALQAVQQQLQAVPGKGLGYGLLRHLGDAGLRERLAAGAAPLVCFNYLGQIDAGTQEGEGWLHWIDEPAGATHSPRNRRSHLLDVDAHVAEGCLQVRWTYCPAVHAAVAIAALADDFMRRLGALANAAAHGVEHEAVPDLVAADEPPAARAFPLAGVAPHELQALLARWPAAEDIYPLAPLQAGLLFHSLPGADSQALYVNQLQVEIRSPLQVDAFSRAWQEAVAQHGVLRTVFAWEGLEHPHQVVLARAQLPIERLDWRDDAQPAGPDALGQFVAADLARGFALDQAPLMRVTLIRTEAGWHMVWTRHHLLLDGWSSARLLMQVFERYAALVRGTPAGADAAAVRPYRDHIQWLQQRDSQQDEAFWRDQLAGLEEPSLLRAPPGRRDAAPAGMGRRSDAAPAGMARSVHALPHDLSARLGELARRQRVTLNTLVQGAWAYVLSRHLGRRDVVFGITVAGRPAELDGAEAMMGLFINTLPLRVQLAPAATLADWWQALQRRNAALRDHEHVQLAQLQATAGRIAGPLFDTLLVFENYPVDRAGIEALRDVLDLGVVRSDETLSLPLTLVVYPGTSIGFEFVWRHEHFDASAIDALGRQFVAALEAFAQGPATRPLGALALGLGLGLAAPDGAPPTPPQRAPHPGPDTLVARFERQAAATPGAVAVVSGTTLLSYRELNDAANRVAQALQRQGVGPEVPVALHLHRSAQQLVAILGVLKAGGFYVPLDPASPAERLRHIVADCAARCLVHDGSIPAGLAVPALHIDEMPGGTVGNPGARAQAGNLAYVIYTSGTTGGPKGVPVTHANVARLFDTTAPIFRFGSGDVWTLFHSYAFDFSVWEMWGALLHGGRLVVVPQEATQDQQAFLELLRREVVTVLNQTPAAFYALSDAALAVRDPGWALRCVIFGGDTLDLTRLAAWMGRFGDARPELVNMYGITETTVHVTWRRLAAADLGHRSFIGRALPDLRLQVLDDAMQPLPAGVAGELYVGGAGVARGYLNRPDLSAERFVPDPWSPEPGARMYRSGDLGRLTPDGDIEYLGRADQQVKVRGFRIEPGEVELRLRSHPGVRDAAVLARPDAGGALQLVAYVVPAQAMDAQALRDHVQAALPAYMVPATFVAVDALPVTGNGKLDRKALLALSVAAAGPAGQAPRTPLEQQIAAIWRDVLQLDEVGIHDDFFMRGGHSLLATRTMARLRRSTGVSVGIADLFKHASIAALATRIEQLRQATSAPSFMTELLDVMEQESQSL